MKAAGIKQFGRLCFVAGTIVSRCGDASAKAIEQVELGSKVQPNDVNHVDTTDPDPDDWRKITLRALNSIDADVEIELLRPQIWLESQGAVAGSIVHVKIPELHLDGSARILRIDACPLIQAGQGALVTGRFSHISDDLVDVWVEGLEEPITGTSRHPFWSVTRQAWIPACKLEAGEMLETKTGRPAQVVSIGFRDDAQRVYNLEVDRYHCFRVGVLGLLVHNSSFNEQMSPWVANWLDDNDRMLALANAGIQDHHLIPWDNQTFRHWEHPLATLAGINQQGLKKYHKNIIPLLNHAGPHSETYHNTVDALMSQSLMKVQKGRMSPMEGIDWVLAKLKQGISDGSIRPYDTKDVFIP